MSKNGNNHLPKGKEPHSPAFCCPLLGLHLHSHYSADSPHLKLSLSALAEEKQYSWGRGGSYEAEKKSLKLSTLTQQDMLYNTAEHFSAHCTPHNTTRHHAAQQREAQCSARQRNLRGALHNTVLHRGALQQHNTTSTSIVLMLLK